MRVRPISPSALVEEIADAAVARLAATGARWLRIAVDGPPPAEPGRLAAALVDPLRVRGRAALQVRADDFLRPASLRLEHGRTNPDAYYEDWLDVAGLRREALDPLGAAGSGRVLPALWNAATDRAARVDYVALPPGGVLLVSGAMLLGAGLPFDLAVHLAMSAAALARRTDADLAWTLPAYRRYAEEVGPEGLADIVVRCDDPRHPAIALTSVANGP
jgi:hypothetical protein